MKLEPIIGLEIHVQLKTKSKMFCGCDNSGEDKPINSCIDPVCLGHPGVLPVPNKTAIEWSLKACLALNCTIPHESKFDRKHYFYPDLPKGYQISQYDKPFGKNGFLVIDNEKIRINRLHLEEDAAKLLHPGGASYSLVDYNRGGTPLMEIVTEPDMRGPRIAGEFLRTLRAMMRVLEISDADMEKGHLRCDANISLRPRGENTLHPKTEIKNLNSFKAVERALAYEIKRQTLLWEKGTPPKIQSTRGWDENKGVTTEQRTKEEAHDYRYFPEPDIPPMVIANESGQQAGREGINLEKIKRSLPELPQAKQERFHNQYGFSRADAALLTRDYDLADYTEKVMSELTAWIESLEQKNIAKTNERLAKLAANWLLNNLAPLIDNTWDELVITPENFAEFVALIAEGKINSRAAQTVLEIMLKTKRDPSDIIETENLTQVGKSDELAQVIQKVIKENAKVVEDYKSGKENAIKFLLGGVMRETKGRANPQVVEEMLKKALAKS